MNLLVSWWLVLLILFIIAMIVVLIILVLKEKKEKNINLVQKKSKEYDVDKLTETSNSPLPETFLEKSTTVEDVLFDEKGLIETSNVISDDKEVEELIVDLNYDEFEKELAKIDDEFDKVVPKKELIDEDVKQSFRDIKIESIDMVLENELEDANDDSNEDIVLPEIKINK